MDNVAVAPKNLRKSERVAVVLRFLSYPILSYLILSHLILSHLILSYRIVSYEDRIVSYIR